MSQAPGRSAELDLFKTLLVIGMIATHVIQLVGRQLPDWTDRFAEMVNLVTFSGFMLAFGLGLGLARGAGKPLMARLRPVVLLLVAAWVSSFAFALLVDRERLTAELALDVLSMRRLFGWSEFLATFFVLYLVVALARPVLVGIATRPSTLAMATALCFATWLTLDQGWPLTAALIGTTRFASFPLIPYLPWFLVGIAIGRDGGRLHWWHWLLAGIASTWLAWSISQTGEWPGRFPPTVLWIVGPALPILLYLALAKWLTWLWTLPGWMTVPGRHVLSFLLASNLMLFASRRLWGRPVDEVWLWLAASAGIIGLIGAIWLWREPRASARSHHKGGAGAAPDLA